MKTSDQAAELATAAADYWETVLEENPIFATVIGDRRFDSRLSDISPAGRSRRESAYEEILARCSRIRAEALTGSGRLTLSALVVEARAQADYSKCSLEEWTVDPLQGIQVELLNLEGLQPVRSPVEGTAFAARLSAFGPYMDQHISNLSRGYKSGRVAVRDCVAKVIDELEGTLSKPEGNWPMLKALQVAHPDWKESELKAFRESVAGAVDSSVRPAFRKYLEFLRGDILLHARPQEKPGIVHITGGAEAYAKLIRYHTSLDLAPEELHQTGLREVARINGEMEVLGEKVFGTRDRPEILKKLRTDPSLYFSSRDEVQEKAETALARAKAAMGKWFGRLPKTDCVVVRMGEHEEKHSTIAYYRQPAADGSRPGQYFINTYAPETRPRYEAEVLAYHESIPGHHLQIAIAQELEGIPEFRKNSGVTAFIEGWGLYTERLSDEMGLYSSDLDRIGVLSYDSWRACRLVVDTGMHAMGWTRAQAIKFMLENSALAENNIVNEVDRYITWPGQALAYKTGQLEIRRLRAAAEESLGSSFDIKKFHDAVLSDGAVPLESLRQILGDYAKSK
ncbi:MAG: DUF885 domain-containing protein [archaeon]|nr:MAG: DUF885 domain-containing protein [archaeon]